MELTNLQNNQKSAPVCQNCKYFDTEESEYHRPDTVWCMNPVVQKGANCRKAEISWAWVNYCHGNLFEKNDE